MWEIELVERAGTTVLIFYKNDQIEDGEVLATKGQTFPDPRGQIICHDKDEVELWQTVLPILNSKNE